MAPPFPPPMVTGVYLCTDVLIELASINMYIYLIDIIH